MERCSGLNVEQRIISSASLTEPEHTRRERHMMSLMVKGLVESILSGLKLSERGLDSVRGDGH
jgi:hypothetical protein